MYRLGKIKTNQLLRNITIHYRRPGKKGLEGLNKKRTHDVNKHIPQARLKQ